MDKKLSLKDLGCNSSCCRHGSPYVLPEERDAIVDETKLDFFTPEGNHFVIGKNNNGKRDMEKDQCPYLKDNLCELQIINPDLKPKDCYMHPVFPKVDADENIKLFVSHCCEAHKNLPKEYIEKARKLIEEYPKEHLEGLFKHQFDYGFPLIELNI